MVVDHRDRQRLRGIQLPTFDQATSSFLRLDCPEVADDALKTGQHGADLVGRRHQATQVVIA